VHIDPLLIHPRKYFQTLHHPLFGGLPELGLLREALMDRLELFIDLQEGIVSDMS